MEMNRRYYELTALLLGAEVVCMLATLGILGAAIDWPASLDYPAQQILPQLVEQSGAVFTGYTTYLLSSLLFVPIAVLLYYVLAERDAPSPLLVLAAVFGVTSGMAKVLGIVRWLALMPFLAETYTAPGASAATREAVVVMYLGFNEYAGVVGEFLGVGLLTGLFVALLAVSLVRSSQYPSWLGWSGLAVAALLLATIPANFGVELGPVLTVSGFAVQLWLAALAVVVFRARPRAADRTVSDGHGGSRA